MKGIFHTILSDRSNRLLLGRGLARLFIRVLTSFNYGIFRDEFYYVVAVH